MPRVPPSKPSEAEVVWWLKRALSDGGLSGRGVREIIVDADSSYLHSRFRKQLEPTGAVWIGDWRPDVVCVIEGDGAERLAGFEVKSVSEHEKGVVQAGRYRAGVHESYLCVPDVGGTLPPWLRSHATAYGVGLLTASPSSLEVDLLPTQLVPDPRILQVTRRYLLGEVAARAFGLNRPLHYAAATYAAAFSIDPVRALSEEWQLGEASIPLAFRGAETLGLVAGELVSVKGKAFADALRYSGFSFRDCRHLTAARARLVTDAPHLAALLRTVLLQHPSVDLIVGTLARDPLRALTVEELAARALRVDEGLTRAVFGPPPIPGQPWQIRPTTSFQLKAALYDVGLIDSRLARGAGRAKSSGSYEPHTDVWQMGAASNPSSPN